MKTVLFICTANYYRSRFAEAIFNHHADVRGLPWRAFSRGLAIWMVSPIQGPIAHEVRHLMKQRNIPDSHTGAEPTQLTRPDLESAARIIALKEEEHRPMMDDLFPDWTERIEYWSVHDIDQLHPDQALPQIEKQVIALIDSLAKKLN